MKIAHLDLFSGISGDMTLGALVDAGLPLADLKRVLAGVPLQGYALRARRVMKGPISATQVDVKIDHPDHHHHTPLKSILAMLRKSRIPAEARDAASSVFTVLGRAEGKIHGVDPMKVEFHEVGAVDSIVDIVGACAGFHLLGIGAITCGPVPITHGTIRGDHGEIPLPGPATMELLKGFPLTSLDLDREIVTPTGAALLAALAKPGPFEMTLSSVGYGAGGWDLARPNVLRILVGETAAPEESDFVYEIRTNLDNAPGDLVGYVFEKLFAAGALDVWIEPIQMKKSRPGVILAAIVPPSRREAVERVLLRETPTFGVRRALLERSKLDRREDTVKTPYGPVRVKRAIENGRVVKSAPEYEDVKAAAERHGVPFATVLEAARNRGYH